MKRQERRRREREARKFDAVIGGMMGPVVGVRVGADGETYTEQIDIDERCRKRAEAMGIENYDELEAQALAFMRENNMA